MFFTGKKLAITVALVAVQPNAMIAEPITITDHENRAVTPAKLVERIASWRCADWDVTGPTGETHRAILPAFAGIEAAWARSI